MKKSLIALLVAGALAIPAFAQQTTSTTPAQGTTQAAPAPTKADAATGKDPLQPDTHEGFWGKLNPFARKKYVQRQTAPIRDRVNELDELTAANGKTIEITNTDAEGRLVLADAMWYARREGATHLLDLATLTGAMELALGDFYAGAFANEDDWMTEILAAAEASGDHTWPFPLHPRYRRYVDSSFADLKNSSDLRQGSPVLAAEFLREFAGEGPWAHIDMAGPGFLTRSRGDYLTQQGGTGYGVRLIAELASQLAA